MPTFNVNFEGVTIPDGLHTARVVDVTEEVSQAGNPMIVWTFALQIGKTWHERTLRVWTAITPAALWKLAEVLGALGIKVDNGNVSFKSEDLKNRMCRVQVVERPYKGQMQPSIDKVLPFDPVGKKWVPAGFMPQAPTVRNANDTVDLSSFNLDEEDENVGAAFDAAFGVTEEDKLDFHDKMRGDEEDKSSPKFQQDAWWEAQQAAQPAPDNGTLLDEETTDESSNPLL